MACDGGMRGWEREEVRRSGHFADRLVHILCLSRFERALAVELSLWFAACQIPRLSIIDGGRRRGIFNILHWLPLDALFAISVYADPKWRSVICAATTNAARRIFQRSTMAHRICKVIQ